jgi:hypothetical protein
VAAEVTLSDNIAEAIEAIEGGTDHFLAALVTEARDRFQSGVHVITGAMRESASVVTTEGSDYAEHVAAAAALNPKAEFASEAGIGPHEAVLQVPVNYAAYEEFGTVHRPAHPALVPAIESTVADADAIAKRAFGN